MKIRFLVLYGITGSQRFQVMYLFRLSCYLLVHHEWRLWLFIRKQRIKSPFHRTRIHSEMMSLNFSAMLSLIQRNLWQSKSYLYKVSFEGWWNSNSHFIRRVFSTSSLLIVNLVSYSKIRALVLLLCIGHIYRRSLRSLGFLN